MYTTFISSINLKWSFRTEQDTYMISHNWLMFLKEIVHSIYQVSN